MGKNATCLVEIVIPELGCEEKEPGFQDDHCIAHRYSVKVFQLDLCYCVLVNLHKLVTDQKPKYWPIPGSPILAVHKY